MKIITVQIGNSDDKLSQQQWSDFAYLTGREIAESSGEIYFSGFSHGGALWQNACWVFSISGDKGNYALLKEKIKEIRKKFNQDSVAWTEGETEFL